MPAVRIDLNSYRDPKSRIFSGRVRGEQVRLAARLPELDTSDTEIEVHVPEDAFSVTSSFFLGMFRDSINLLGEEPFRRRFRFTGKNIQRVVDESIKEALKRSSPLALV